ncbi:MAG: cytochrome PufQ [Cereibacter changlensis]|uniref:Protein pufQ n=2 Tax=Cereibacter changlensis TaxID=402884 RepID=A0A2T4JTH1_9RHOB|nr:cytochrome PufQ [Cereibacter changlensis]PTE21176.1 protein pufQ [Cereibacter changlensis JA139]PZX54410.1 PufQ cytochrome subunit [Cereibacter changlensis]
MSDHTANSPVHAARAHGHRAPRAEFYAYFVVILMGALPVALLTWMASVVRHGRLPARGPFASAWFDAKAITPLIFRA